MKKLLVTMFLLVTSINCFAVTAKWTKQDNWRKIKDNMPEAAVKKLLGAPKFKTYTTVYEYNLKRTVGTNSSKTRQDYIGKIYYYSSKEPLVNENKQIELNFDGYVSFHKTSNNSKLFAVNKIKEPDFSKVEDIPKETTKKLKPKRKLEKWQNEKVWTRLKIGMSDKAALNLLGEPTQKKEEKGEYKYYYGKHPLCGVIIIDTTESDTNNTLKDIAEPFWYLLNKELYEEVKPKAERSEVNNTKTKTPSKGG